MNQTEFVVIMNRCKQIKDDAEKRILLKEEIINDARFDIIFEKRKLFVIDGMIKTIDKCGAIMNCAEIQKECEVYIDET